MINFQFMPLQERSIFRLDGYHTWGGSLAHDQSGYHLYVSIWPKDKGHDGWVTHSEIVHAISDDACGPFAFKSIVLGKQETDSWDRDVAHNPTIMHSQGRYYLFYTGNRGNGKYWDHQNQQRVGVAVADNPDGPFERCPRPLLNPGDPGSWDDLMTTNPSCARMPDGRFILLYKASKRNDSPSRNGEVKHGVAFAHAPTGPFTRRPAPIFQCPGIRFAGEDPFVFSYGERLYAILKDMGAYYSSHERALVSFTSTNGIDWEPCENPVVLTRQITMADGSRVTFHRLERPQLYLENGEPRVLCCAVKPSADNDESYNIQLRIAGPRI